MNLYVTYQCTICRRKKDLQKDNIRVIPSLCSITKGCTGKMYIVGEKNSAFLQTKPEAGVLDWYPRNQTLAGRTAPTEVPFAKFSSSATGGLTLAVAFTDEEALQFSTLTMRLSQRKVESVTFAQFIYSTFTPQAVFTGRDSQGRNLRIDSTAVAEERLKVKVNGVDATDFTVSPDGRTLTFATEVPTGSVVDITLFAEKDTEQRNITFTTNRTVDQNSAVGAWGNVRWVNRITSLGNVKLWLYTATSVSSIGNSSRVRIDGIFADDEKIDASKMSFLFAASPFSNADRYLTLSVPLEICESDFNIVTVREATREFTIPETLLKNEYPLLQIRRGYTTSDNSLSTPDVLPQPTGRIPSDTESVLLKSSIVNGSL